MSDTKLDLQMMRKARQLMLRNSVSLQTSIGTCLIEGERYVYWYNHVETGCNHQKYFFLVRKRQQSVTHSYFEANATIEFPPEEFMPMLKEVDSGGD